VRPCDVVIHMSDVAGKDYWNAIWRKLPPVQPYAGPVYEQHQVLARFLSKAGGGEAIEIGCGSGNYMIYIAKEFGYHISGLDYSNNMEYVRANLEFNGIHDADLFNVDLFEFKPSKRYDLVLSGGFVEHFDDYERVVRKHAELAKPGGLVVIIVPNLTHVHWLLCSIWDPETLKVHRFPLMRRRILSDTLEKAGLEVIHCEYHRTFRPTYRLPLILDHCSRAIQKGLAAMRLDDIGNPLASPYLISVSRKK
jgi:cyclopropane fatty-acyl-phospholipid synthase-like methyltransferase